MNDPRKLPYAGWLEETIAALSDMDVKCVCLAAVLNTDQVFTSYFDAALADKTVMAAFIQGDAMLDMAVANAKMIVEAAETDEEE